MTMTLSPRVLLVCLYAFTMPLLAGMPRGEIVPFLRPTEVIQLLVTAGAIALAFRAQLTGERWRLTIRSHEWWLMAMAFFASVVPLLWLKVRSMPVGGDEVMAVFPLIKYAALYFLVRFSIVSARDVRAVFGAVLAAAVVVSVVGVAQVLGVGPVVNVLGSFFVSGPTDDVLGGRATATLGSSIAIGAFLSMSLGVAMSLALSTRRALWLGVSCVLGIGALASGQAGTVIMLGVVVFVVAYEYKALAMVAAAAIPAGALATLGLWQVVAARLADIDGGTGLPQSWVIRWSNLSDIYWPQIADGGWLLGVSPDAIVTPVDVFRDEVFLESGYLWMLWVGGIPLLTAMVAFLGTCWRATGSGIRAHSHNGTAAVARVSARAAIALIAVMSVIDPHITLRGGADLFFMMIPIALAPLPPLARLSGPKARWSQLMGAGSAVQARHTARLQIGESKGSLAFDAALFTYLRRSLELSQRWVADPKTEAETESQMLLVVRDKDTMIGTAHLRFVRRSSALHGLLTDSVVAIDADAAALIWRAIALVSGGLKLDSLAYGSQALVDTPLQMRSNRSELVEAARLAADLEQERYDTAPDIASRSDRRRDMPAIRLEVGHRIPLWKRTTDIVLCLIGVVLAAPIGLVCAYLVKRSSEGPVLFRQTRIGAGGVPFQLLKFRTMFIDNDDSAHRAQNEAEIAGEAPGVKDADDPRITRIGKFLRRTSLDELPQLVNVLGGDMSLVGPRPSLLWEVELFPPAMRKRLQVRPGVTGLWQISGRGDVAMNEMLELDLEYLEQMSPATDTRCILGTAAGVVRGEGAK